MTRDFFLSSSSAQILGFLVLWSKMQIQYITPTGLYENSTSVTSFAAFYCFHTSNSISYTGLQLLPTVWWLHTSLDCISVISYFWILFLVDASIIHSSSVRHANHSLRKVTADHSIKTASSQQCKSYFWVSSFSYDNLYIIYNFNIIFVFLSCPFTRKFSMIVTIFIYFVWCYVALASRKIEWQMTVTLCVFFEAIYDSSCLILYL